MLLRTLRNASRNPRTAPLGDSRHSRGTASGYKNLLFAAISGVLASMLLLGFTFLQERNPAHAAGVVSEVHAPFTAATAIEVEAEPEPVPIEQLEGTRVGGGAASFYGSAFAGRRTANGERFSPEAMTAAHRTLPFGSKVRVINVRNGRSVVVRINDRGPFHGNRVIDLSKGAARELGFVNSGTAPVEIELLRVRS